MADLIISPIPDFPHGWMSLFSYEGSTPLLSALTVDLVKKNGLYPEAESNYRLFDLTHYSYGH
jgi:hypothetical protein